MLIKTLDDVEVFLEPLIKNASTFMKDDLTLDRMWGLLVRVGNPHEKLKVIHVAGTSGKTSTCYYISSLLEASCEKVGLTVSPHIVSITERVQLNTKPLDEALFVKYFNEFVSLIGDEALNQSYFEFMIVFALWVFVQEGVDYAVLETGLGGRFDSTNVVERADKVCVITDIGFDHQHILGNTLQEIAYQKAGIIHEGNAVLFNDQESVIINVLQKEMKLKNAHFVSVDIKNEVKFDELAYFQIRNLQLAYSVSMFVAKRDGFVLGDIDPRIITIPGRIQKIIYKNKEVILDGAHNPQKMKAFVTAIQQAYPKRKFDILLAMRSSKDYRSTIQELAPIAQKIFCIELSSQKKSQSVPPDDLKIVSENAGIDAYVAQSIDGALLSFSEDIVIVTGSLYLTGSLLKMAYNDAHE